MSKGLAFIPVIVAIIIVVIATAIVAHFAFFENIAINMMVLEQGVLMAVNNNEGGKMLSETTLIFGSYQGIYDFGKQSGFGSAGTSYWVESGTATYPNDTEFKENLRKTIENRVNDTINNNKMYSDEQGVLELSDFAISVEEQTEGVKIIGTLANPIKATKSLKLSEAMQTGSVKVAQDIKIMETEIKGIVKPTVVVKTKIFRLYELGKEVINDVQKDIIDTISCSGTPIECGQLSENSCPNQLDCSWDKTQNKCIGIARFCDQFNSKQTCHNQMGCSWTSESELIAKVNQLESNRNSQQASENINWDINLVEYTDSKVVISVSVKDTKNILPIYDRYRQKAAYDNVELPFLLSYNI